MRYQILSRATAKETLSISILFIRILEQTPSPPEERKERHAFRVRKYISPTQNTSPIMEEIKEEKEESYQWNIGQFQEIFDPVPEEPVIYVPNKWQGVTRLAPTYTYVNGHMLTCPSTTITETSECDSARSINKLEEYVEEEIKVYPSPYKQFSQTFNPNQLIEAFHQKSSSIDFAQYVNNQASRDAKKKTNY